MRPPESTTDHRHSLRFTPQNSSVEGVFPAGGQRPSHPFRIIEQDAMSIQSMTSLGRVGRILAGSLDAASLSGGSGAPPAIAAAVDRQPVAAAPPVGGQPLPQQQQQQSSPSEQLAAAATPAAEPLRQSPSPVQKINFSGESDISRARNTWSCCHCMFPWARMR